MSLTGINTLRMDFLPSPYVSSLFILFFRQYFVGQYYFDRDATACCMLRLHFTREHIKARSESLERCVYSAQIHTLRLQRSLYSYIFFSIISALSYFATRINMHM